MKESDFSIFDKSVRRPVFSLTREGVGVVTNLTFGGLQDLIEKYGKETTMLEVIIRERREALDALKN